jgi:phosphate uptake regulator
MFSFRGLNENFTFLVVRLQRQLEETLGAMEFGERAVPERMKLREDYIDTLKITIERKSYHRILKSRAEDEQVIRMMGALNTAVCNLEEIGDYLINIVVQLQYLKDPAFLGRFDYQRYFRHIGGAFDLITGSLLKGIIRDALLICQTESELDRLFKEDFDRILEILRQDEHIGDAITALNIFRYLERIGDSLLNIGEAVISAHAGSRLKFFEYLALKEKLTVGSGHFRIQGPLAETRSGCRIERVVSRQDSEVERDAIFKEGDGKKILREKEKLERWQTVMPGMTPRVLGFQPLSGKAFMLLEYIDGLNFQELLLRRNDPLLRRAFTGLTDVAETVWSRTKRMQIRPATFIPQLLSKLPEVYEIHSGFDSPSKGIGMLERLPFAARLEEAARIEEHLPPPFSVLVHGDFNADNILYHPREDRIYYIDLHRSEDLDYVQDVAVFLVSNFRMPLFSRDLRRKLTEVNRDFFTFAGDFARRNGDETFESRLALGLIRSLISSTRFILREEFAKVLYLRGIYLLDRLLDHEGRPWEDFRLPGDLLVY